MPVEHVVVPLIIIIPSLPALQPRCDCFGPMVGLGVAASVRSPQVDGSSDSKHNSK